MARLSFQDEGWQIGKDRAFFFIYRRPNEKPLILEWPDGAHLHHFGAFFLAAGQ